MQVISKFRIVKRGVRLQQGTLWLHKNYWLFRYLITQLLGVSYIVTADTKYLHTQACLDKYIGYNSPGLFIPYIQALIKHWIFKWCKFDGAAKIGKQGDKT
jgi:hypothetical protein